MVVAMQTDPQSLAEYTVNLSDWLDQFLRRNRVVQFSPSRMVTPFSLHHDYIYMWRHTSSLSSGRGSVRPCNPRAQAGQLT
jgi:hypothetical protein